MLICIDWIWEVYNNLGRKCVPCVIPPYTLKSDESEPGLEPRYPLHSSSHKQRLRTELGTPSPKFPGVLLRDSSATSWPCAGPWLCAYLPSLSMCCAVQWNKVRAGAARCPGKAHGRVLGEQDARCVWHEDIHGFGRSGSPVPRLSLSPQAVKGSAASPFSTQALMWEKGSRHSREASAEYASILFHVCLTGKTVETNVWVLLCLKISFR